ncbi:hypothetical protein AAVH_04261 [Aphelenchoides avenae]|nr:hypothetical protein AAVH_04261 [Aphelenchus avenae]
MVNTIPLVHTIPQATTSANLTVTSVTTPTKTDDDDEDFMKKREDRKIRNRAAAQLSRQRKRNEFDELRKRLEDGMKEREALRRHNESLKKRVEELETEVPLFLSNQI